MPLAYRIDPDQRLVIITGDYAEPGEWRQLLTAVVEDPEYRRGSSFVRDLRHSANPVDAAAVMGIIAVVREFWPQLGTYRAVMVTRHGVDVPAVMAEALALDERMPLRAFTSYQEAIQWATEGRS
jgi:hypothetical protein